MKDATLTPAIELLEAIRESGLAPSQVRKLIELTGQKDLCGPQFVDLLQSPLYPDLLEAARLNRLSAVDRVVFRHILGLPPLGITQPVRSWREENNIIYFSVTSDGTTGEGWITRLESKGFRVGDYAKQVLRSPDFKPTSGVTTEVAVLKGVIFADNQRITKTIRAHAKGCKFTAPNAEIACLIREMFSDEEIEALGLIWIVAMHEPIDDSDGGPRLLSADRVGAGRWLGACSGGPGDGWPRESGFAFAVSQVGPQK